MQKAVHEAYHKNTADQYQPLYLTDPGGEAVHADKLYSSPDPYRSLSKKPAVRTANDPHSGFSILSYDYISKDYSAP